MNAVDKRIKPGRERRLLADRFSDMALDVIRPIVEAWMRIVGHRSQTTGPGVDLRRREPFVLLANHTFRLDVVHVPLPFSVTPHIVASRDLLVGTLKRFVLTRVARCIPTAKGKGDIRAIKTMIGSIKRGYPIMIFPEGDITFFGHTRPIEESVARLVKMMRVDLITCRVTQGYHSMPRWATAKRERRAIKLDYRLAMTREQVLAASPEEIRQVIEQALTVDQYEDQRSVMRSHPCEAPAEGLEDALYVCPECQAINSMEAEGARLWCSHCGTEGRVDEYGFIHGFRFADTVAWDRYQRGFRDQLIASSFSATGQLREHDYNRWRERVLGTVTATYRDGVIQIQGAAEFRMPVSELRHVIVTLRSKLNYQYKGIHYVLKLDHRAMAFLRVCSDAF